MGSGRGDKSLDLVKSPKRSYFVLRWRGAPSLLSRIESLFQAFTVTTPFDVLARPSWQFAFLRRAGVSLLSGIAASALLAAGPVSADEPERSIFVWNADPDSENPTSEPWANPLNWLDGLATAIAPPTIEDIARIEYGGAVVTDGVDATAYSLALSGGLNVNAGGTLTVTTGIVNTAPEDVYFNNAGQIFADIDNAGYLINAGEIEGKLVLREDGVVYNETSAEDGAPRASWVGDVENAGDIDNKGGDWQGDVLSNTGKIITYQGATWDGDVLTNNGQINVQDTSSWTGTVHSNNGNLVLSSAEASWTGDVLDSFGSINSVGSWYGSITSTGWLFLSGYVEGDISLSWVDPDRGSLFYLNGDLTVGGDIAIDGTLSLLAAEGAQTLQAANLKLSDESWFEVGIDDQGHADRVELTGAATLAGNLWVGAAEGDGYAEDMRYSILVADSVSGMFGYVGTDLAFLTPMLSTDGSEVFLVLKRNGFSFADGATGTNDKTAAGAVEALGAGDPLYEAALNLTGDEAPGAFVGLAGDVHVATPSTVIATSAAVANQVVDHLQQSFDAVGAGAGPNAYAPAHAAAAAPVAGPWGAIYGLSTETAADAGLPGYESVSGGLVGGADTMLGDWRVGVVLEAGATRSEMAKLDASADTTSYGAGLYAGREWGDTRFVFGGTLAGHNIRSTRTVTLPDVQTLEADYGASTATTFAELSHRFDLGAVELTPRFGITHVRYDSDSFTETGGDAALSGQASQVNSTFTTLGLDAGRQFAFDNGVLITATGSIGWRHAFGDAATGEHAFAGGDAFTVYGTAQPADALVLGADIAFDLSESTTLGLSYAGEHADGGMAQSLTAGWSGRF